MDDDFCDIYNDDFYGDFAIWTKDCVLLGLFWDDPIWFGDHYWKFFADVLSEDTCNLSLQLRNNAPPALRHRLRLFLPNSK